MLHPSKLAYRLMVVLFLLGRTLMGNAQEWTVWDMTNSPLPSTTVTALAEDLDGGLWVGTDWGLCHFDGQDWEVYQAGTSGLPENSVNGLAVDASGRVWIATDGAGVVVYDGIGWTNFTPDNSDLPEFSVRDIFIDHRDWAWMTTSGGLACYTGIEWRVYDDTPESYNGLVLHSANTLSVAVRTDGLVCLGTLNGGLHYITDTEVSYLTTFEHGFFDNTASGVLFDPASGDRWVGTPAAGLLRQQGPPAGGVWYQWNSAIDFPSNGLNCIARDVLGRIWAGTQFFGVVQVMDEDTWVQFTPANSGMPDNEVLSVLASSDGSIWIGTTYGGLARYRTINSVSEDDNGKDMLAFPSPCSDVLNVKLMGRLGAAGWSLIDGSGRSVREGNVFSQADLVIPVHDLAAGPYTLIVVQETKRVHQKVLVVPASLP